MTSPKMNLNRQYNRTFIFVITQILFFLVSLHAPLQASMKEEWPGIIDAERVSRLVSQTSGVIKKTNITKNSIVEKGQVLAVINTELLEVDLLAVNAQKDGVKAELDQAIRNLSRINALHKKGAASEETIEEANTRRLTLNSRYQQLEAESKSISIKIDNGTIRAPYQAVVLNRYLNVGSFADDETEIVELAEINSFIVKVSVPEAWLKKLDQYSHAKISIPALDKLIEGNIIGVEEYADYASQSVILRISIPYQKRLIRHLSAKVLSFY